jgi:hypothetical protein
LFDPRTSRTATIDALVGDKLLESLVRHAHGQVTRAYFVTHLPALVREISHDRKTVMMSTQMCEKYSVDGGFGVQHCVSRIVVDAHVGYDGFVTAVGAKPWEDQVCRHGAVPGPPWRQVDGPLWYHRYALLGIGERVYRRAAELVPGARWKAGELTPFSEKLRAKLHRLAPYLWQFNGCQMCRGVVDWVRAAESDFPPHRMPTGARERHCVRTASGSRHGRSGPLEPAIVT